MLLFDITIRKVDTMSSKARGKFMRVSVDLLDMIDFKMQYETQLALTLLYKGQALYESWDDTYIETTPSLLIKTFQSNLARGQEKNVIRALTDMRDRGLIIFEGDIEKFKDEVTVDIRPLIDLANTKGNYVELRADDFYRIMQCDNNIKINGEVTKAKNGYESLLLQTFLVIKARWNFKTIDMLAQVDDFSYAINSDEEVQQAKGVFCSDTLDFIRTHKHYSLEEVDAWCDDRYLSGYLEKLEEIGCIKTYSRKMKVQEGMWKNRKFYYVPTMKFECIDAMVRQYARRNNFAIKEQQESNEQPIQPKQSSFVQQHRNTARGRKYDTRNW